MNAQAINQYINSHDGPAVADNFCSIFASDEVMSFINCADRLKAKKDKKLPYAIYNSDYSDRQGTHWYLIISLSKTEVFIFDSLGAVSLKTFVIRIESSIIQKFFRRQDVQMNAKQSPIVFDLYKMSPEGFVNLPDDTTKQLSDTARGLFNLLSGLALTNKQKQLTIYTLDDQLQESDSQWCGVFVLSLIHALYAETENKKFSNRTKVDVNLIKDLIRYLYNEGSVSGQMINSERMKEFAKINKLKLTLSPESDGE